MDIIDEAGCELEARNKHEFGTRIARIISYRNNFRSR